MPSPLTYRDYLGQFDLSRAGDESYTKPMGEYEWGLLSDPDKWKLNQDILDVRTTDPRYNDLRQTLGGDSSRNLSLNYTRGKPLANIVDPSKAREVSPGIHAISDENWQPWAQGDGQENDAFWGLAALSVFAAPAIAALGAGQGLAGAYAPTGADMLGAAAGQGFGTIPGGVMPGGGIPPVGAPSTPNYDPFDLGGYPSESQGFGNVPNNTPSYDPFDLGEYSPRQGGGLSGGDLPHGTEIPNDYGSFTGNPTDYSLHAPAGLPQGGGGLLDAVRSGGTGLLEAAMKDPIRALGLLQTGIGLFQGSRNQTGGGGNGSSGSDIAAKPLPQFKRGGFQPNPFTQQQIQNFRYTGS